jgi:hypothetical protein
MLLTNPVLSDAFTRANAKFAYVDILVNIPFTDECVVVYENAWLELDNALVLGAKHHHVEIVIPPDHIQQFMVPDDEWDDQNHIQWVRLPGLADPVLMEHRGQAMRCLYDAVKVINALLDFLPFEQIEQVDESGYVTDEIAAKK